MASTSAWLNATLPGMMVTNPDDFNGYELLAEILTGVWRIDAACKGMDTELFLDEQTEQEAKAVCAGCPVEVECLDSAVFYEDQGVRGGLTEQERTPIILHRRRQAQLFKHDVGV